jgi:hypothetical protein
MGVRAGVVKLADAPDSKSGGLYRPCRFDSDLRHHISSLHRLPGVVVRHLEQFISRCARPVLTSTVLFYTR